MFPLIASTFPATRGELAHAITAALANVLALPSRDSVVSIVGERFPVIERLEVDLSGASIRKDSMPHKPRPGQERQPGPSAQQFRVIAKPLSYESSRFDLSLDAREVRLDYARDRDGQPMLVLKSAQEGNVQARISHADLQAALLSLASQFAERQKIVIQDLHVTLTQASPRSVAAEVRIAARKMFVTGVISVRGQVNIADDLTATISNLDASGEGVVGAMAAGLIRPQLQPHNGRVVPLLAFSLGDVALRDVSVTVDDGLHVTASFGPRDVA
jgi:hypothetical protein